MTDIDELERRVTALEAFQKDTAETLRWVVAKLGRISAIQDEHTLRLDRIDARLDKIDTRLDKIDARLDKVESQLDRLTRHFCSLREELPGMIADIMRDVLSEKR